MSAGSDPRCALVTDAERGSALAIIRSLGRRGWRVIAASADPRACGLRSRFAFATVVYPDPSRDPEAFVRTIAATAGEHGVDIVLPVTDDTLLPLAANRDAFAGVCRLALPSADALETVVDKERTFELARSLDVPVPHTAAVASPEDLERVGDDLVWPVVVKPRRSRVLESNGIEKGIVGYARDEKELARLLRAAPTGGCLLQQYCPGTGVGVEMVALDGRPLIEFQHRRLAEVPITGGASAWRESVALDPVLVEHARRLVAALSWSGPIMIEFKVGADAWLMEINGRIWGSLPLAVRCGVDIPAVWADSATGYRGDALANSLGTAERPYPRGVRAHDAERLSVWVGSVLFGRRRDARLGAPRRRDAWAAIACLLDPRTRSDLWAADDRDPARGLSLRVARRLFGKLGRRGR